MVDMGSGCGCSAWVSWRGLVACGLMGPGAVGPSPARPGPLWAAQKPGSGSGACTDPGRDHAPKVKPPFCKDSKLPPRIVSGGPEKSCTPYTRAEIKLPFRLVCTVPGAGPISCNQARLPPGVAIPYTHTYQATPPPGYMSSYSFTWGRGLKICCTSTRMSSFQATLPLCTSYQAIAIQSSYLLTSASCQATLPQCTKNQATLSQGCKVAS